MVELAEDRVDRVLAVKRIGIPIVAVLEIVGRAAVQNSPGAPPELGKNLASLARNPR
jgi:hypothetical protein